MIKCPISWLLTVATLLTQASAQSVTHRWSFNSPGGTINGTIIPDSISSAPGTIVGTRATRSGSVLTLPGGSTGQVATSTIAAYFDLPNGIISSKKSFTVEVWATLHTSRTWQRIFDFGRMDIAGGSGGEIPNTYGNPGGSEARDNLMLAAQRGEMLNDKRLAARNDGNTEIGANNTIATSLNTQYYYVAIYQANTDPATGGRFTWFRDRAQMGFLDTSFPLSQLEDVNNWLGRSQWSGNQNSNISYNEFRLYDHALTPAQITANSAAGPDKVFPAPTVVPDAVTMLHGNKARLKVLSNDSGEIVPTTLSIDQDPASGTATVSADGTILYTHTLGTPTTDSFIYRISNTTGQSSTGTVTVTFANSLKIANPHLNIPASPPATFYALPNALGSLTFSQPLCLVTPPGETQRLFVCEKGGLLKVVTDVTAVSPAASVFLNLTSYLTSRGEAIDTGSECGLLGLAFHPNYASNRQFYIFYSVTKGGLRYQRVSRFLTQAGNPNAAEISTPGPELILIEQRDEQGNHNGGDLHFGPADGYLYISVGDEGSGNDDPTFNSQLINKDLFSGILRIDVDRVMANSVEPTAHAAIPLDAGVARFAVPKTNPFVLPAQGGDWNGQYNGSTVTGTVRREFWATGLRNPWRISFDPVTGTLWCGDVGQGAREEIDIIVRGANYGWVFREALLTGPRTTNPTMPANFDALYHEEPIYNYVRPGNVAMAPDFQGYSITGGRVYRGTRLGALTGKYIFGDYGTGNIWSMNLDGTGVQRISGEAGIAGFGVDPSNQDLLLADLGDGVVRRLTSTTATGTFPATLTATGLFADLSDLSPAPGVTPYGVNLPFWSDHADKSRWFVVPNGSSSFGWAQETPWSLPSGTIWVKHFDMVMNRNPVPPAAPVRKRVETRLIVKNPAGAYGVSYRWNAAGTEATLAADVGEDFNLAVTDGGIPAPQAWRIPSRAECMVCHTPQAGHALSFNTRQLNLTQSILGFPGNQLDTLRQNSFFTGPQPGSPNLLPRHLRPDEDDFSKEARVRSYLAVNCSYCHKPGGTAPTAWDGRAEITLAESGLVNGTAANNGGDPLNKLVVPGSTAHSIVRNRVAASTVFTRMPPLGSNVIDQTNVKLLDTWISGELADRKTYGNWRLEKFGSSSSSDGAPAEDPDGDGADNQSEFLADTLPLDGSSTFHPQLSGSPPSLGFTLPVNRSFLIETSTTLGQWSPWDVPGNQGLPVAGDPIRLPVTITDPQRFFRVTLREN